MAAQLLNPDNYACTIHALSSLLVGVAVAALGIYVLIRERMSRISVTFWLFTVCISIWLAAFGADYASLRKPEALLWLRLSQMGVSFIPATVLILAFTVVQRSHQFRPFIGASIAASAFFCIGVGFTDLHIQGLYHYFWGYFPRYGPLGVVFLAYFFGVMIYVLRLYWIEYRRSTNDRRKKRLKGLLIAFSIGYTASSDFLAAFGVPLYAFGYIAIVPFLFLTAGVIIRYRLVDITQELAAGQILETMHGAVIVADLEGKIRVINRAAQTMLGSQNPELVNRDLTSFIDLPPELRDHRHVHAGNVHGHEMYWAGEDGRKICVTVSASVVTDRDASPVGIVYVAHDITGRKRAEEQLKKYSEELKQSNEDVMSFAYIVSHDLRAPLLSIKGFASELKFALKEIDPVLDKCMPHLDDKGQKTITSVYRKDVTDAIEFISSSVSRMDGLINAILKLSRMGRRELKPEAVGMKTLVHSILNSLAHQIGRHKVSLTVEELPEIVADKLSMEQIVGNLLDNALKYLEPGRNGEIAVTAEQKEEETIFHICDNGCGIAKDDMHKVFEPFRRAGKQDAPGEGMGLAYVKTLVRCHGGRIWCESELGKGTTFSFTIPRKSDIIENNLRGEPYG